MITFEKMKPFSPLLLFFLLLVSCKNETSTPSSTATYNSTSTPINGSGQLFSIINPKTSGVDFNNVITEDLAHNYYIDQYMYNGGGVAIGDINNDGLPDLYFAGNQVGNKLYLNKGNMKFEDISKNAGVGGSGWCTGVNMVDINADGYLDIYVARGGSNELNPILRSNLLYLNNKNNTFSEVGKNFGLNDSGYSIHSAFFDYDLDGDLDVYITNHPAKFQMSYSEHKSLAENPSDDERDKLYRNNGNGSFTEIAKQFGINNFAHGLGLGIGDLNGDNFPDIYVSNDYQASDNCYFNIEGNNFMDGMKFAFRHTANFSMGMDIADFNNDGLLDICAADMTAEDNFRQKVNMPSMNPKKFYSAIKAGYHPQYMRNALQLNNGKGIYSEIAQMAGIPNTDWSWSVLFADYDNDGLKDLLITNGFLRDIENKDYKKTVEKYQKAAAVTWNELKVGLESNKLPSYIYKNNGDLTFTKMNEQWGFEGVKAFSNGAAYADLDNDGDLDIVINNINDPASIFQNNARSNNQNNYLRLKFKGGSQNLMGLGTKVTVTTDGQKQFQELYNSRGYASAVEPVMHFGFGTNSKIDKVEITWLNGKHQTITDIDANQTLTVSNAEAQAQAPPLPRGERLFADVGKLIGLKHRHKENGFDDYKDQVLLPHEMSRFGPRITVGDVNNDGYDDFYVCGAANQEGELFIQMDDMKFSATKNQPWDDHAQQEDLDALFFDANGDGFQDLYVVSGGNEFSENSPFLQDRLYLNQNGKSFSKTNALPVMTASGGCVEVADYDGDGDLDLFVGGRLTPGKYLKPAKSTILKNNGGTFIDVTAEVAPELNELGMVSSAVWVDYNKDGQMDLVVVGEWMPITVFMNKGGKLENQTSAMGLDINSVGWWNKVIAADFDNDGDMDLVAGNLGLNYKYQSTQEAPFKIYCDDFDNNGKWDIVLGYFQNGTEFPLRGRQCSSEQMPTLEDKFPTYTDFASSDIRDVYGDQLDGSLKAEATEFRTSYIENNKGTFVLKPLDNRAQVAPTFGIVTSDFNGDGNLDIVIAGNFFVAEVETGAADAGIGTYLIGDGKGNFTPIEPAESGLFCREDVRDLAIVNSKSKNSIIIVANNNSALQAFGFARKNVNPK